MEDTAKPVIMTFLKNSVLESPDDIISYILQYYISIPSKITDNYRDYEISLVNDIAIAGGNLDKLRELVVQSLTKVINKHIPIYQYIDIKVSFTAEYKDNPVDNKIVISIDALVNNTPITLELMKDFNKLQ